MRILYIYLANKFLFMLGVPKTIFRFDNLLRRLITQNTCYTQGYIYYRKARD